MPHGGVESTGQSCVFRTRPRWSPGMQLGPGQGCHKQPRLTAVQLGVCFWWLYVQKPATPVALLGTPTFHYASRMQLWLTASKLWATVTWLVWGLKLFTNMCWEVFEDLSCALILYVLYIYIVYGSSKPHLGARDIWKPWVFPKSNWMGKNPACFQLGLSLSVFSSCLAHGEVKPSGLLGWEPQCLDVFMLKIKLSGSSRRKFQLNKDLCFTETKKWCELPQARRQLGAWLTIRI